MVKELGMYELPEMQAGFVKIGEFTLCRQNEGKIWIQHDSGEGGEFAETPLAEVLKKYYEENF